VPSPPYKEISVGIGQQVCRLLLEAGKNVRQLFEPSAVDGFREAALRSPSSVACCFRKSARVHFLF